MTDPAAACVFVPAREPWSCATHPGGYRVSLNETVCRTAQAETIQPMTVAEVEEFDHWAESRRGRGVSLGMLWALRLRATLIAANVRVAAPPSEDAAPLRSGVCACGPVCAACGRRRSEDAAPPCPIHENLCSPACTGRGRLGGDARLREAAEYALAYLADPEGLDGLREPVRIALRAALLDPDR